MARLSLVPWGPLGLVWRAHFRHTFQRGAWKGANLAVVTLLALLYLLAHLGICGGVLVHTQTRSGAPLAWPFELALASLLAGWLLLPILFSGGETRKGAVPIAHLNHLPLTTGHKLALAVAGDVVRPPFWILGAATLATLATLATAPHPVAAVLGGLVFAVLAAAGSFAISFFASALLASRRGREAVMFLASLLMVGLIVAPATATRATKHGLYLDLGSRSILLVDGAGNGLVAWLNQLSPGRLVAELGLGEPWAARLGALTALAALAGGAVFLSFRRTLQNPPERGLSLGRSGRPWRIPGLAEPLAALLEKELRYLGQTLDWRLGLIASLGFSLYAALAPDGVPERLLLVAVALLLIGFDAAIPFNVFGLDGQAVDRYRLLPLTGAQVLRSKSLAFFAVFAVQLVPLWIVITARSGLLLGGASVLSAAGSALIAASWGCFGSIRAPARREFYNFDSREQVGGILSVLVGGAASGIIALVAYELASRGAIGLLLLGVLTALLGVVHEASLVRAGQLFDRSGEAMRKALAD